MGNGDDSTRWRALPSVRALIDDPALEECRGRYSHEALVEAARSVLARARDKIAAGDTVTVEAADVIQALMGVTRPRLRRVINATGVILHTNLGRAPLAEAARAAMAEAAGYANLELRLETGGRGGRDDGVNAHLQSLTGAEGAFAVNNCAAATLLTLSALAAGREVIVSRGELVEIGGGFRVPEVLEQSGCRLVEVGTTNRTRLSDFERAITPNTAAILRVHRSNFALIGFTEDVPLPELARLAHERGIHLLYDQGTGELDIVSAALRAGCDVVTFSGDKLLGGPQAGLVAGRAALVERIRKHPLARALRIDKLGLAALEATLGLWRAGRPEAIPAARMLADPPETVRARAEQLGAAIGEAITWSVMPSASTAGGGTRPGQAIESYAVGVKTERPNVLASLLRLGEVPVVARVAEGVVVLDARTVEPAEIELLAKQVRDAVARLSAGEIGPPTVESEDEEEAAREAGAPVRLFTNGEGAPSRSP